MQTVFDATCTLYNAQIEDETGKIHWHRTILTGVSFHKAAKVAFSEGGGIQAANTAAVNIPIRADTEGKGYLPAHRWKAAEDPSAFWTMQAGDLFAPGVQPEIESERELREKSGDVFEIFYANDSCKGPAVIKHWRMEGK